MKKFIAHAVDVMHVVGRFRSRKLARNDLGGVTIVLPEKAAQYTNDVRKSVKTSYVRGLMEGVTKAIGPIV